MRPCHSLIFVLYRECTLPTLEFCKSLGLDVKVVPLLCVDIGKDLPLLGVSLSPLKLL